MQNENDKRETRTEASGLVDGLVMFDVKDADKKLILHAAYYAVVLHDWRDHVFKAEISKDVKKDLIGKFPCGDPLINLMNLAERLLPEFDEHLSINKSLGMIKSFVYGT